MPCTIYSSPLLRVSRMIELLPGESSKIHLIDVFSYASITNNGPTSISFSLLKQGELVMAQTITAGSTMPATMINAGVTIVISQQVGGAANAVLLIADV